MSPWSGHRPALAGSIALVLAAGLHVVPAAWLAPGSVAPPAAAPALPAAREIGPGTQPGAADARALALEAALPPAGQLAQRLAALTELAGALDVRIDSLQQEPRQPMGLGRAALGGQWVAVRMRGAARYADWRRLVAQALEHDSALVLAQLHLARPGIDTEGRLEGELQWQLLQAADGPATAGVTLARGGSAP